MGEFAGVHSSGVDFISAQLSEININAVYPPGFCIPWFLPCAHANFQLAISCSCGCMTTLEFEKILIL